MLLLLLQLSLRWLVLLLLLRLSLRWLVLLLLTATVGCDPGSINYGATIRMT